MKRSTRLGSIAAAVVGTIALAAWLIKERLTGPAPAGEGKPLAVAPPPPPPPPKPKAAAATKPEAAPKPKPKATPKPKAAPKPEPKTPTTADDDLSEIDGIGPVYKTRLAEAGITTFAALAAADAAGIAEQIQAPVSRIQAWVDAARRRA